MRRAGSVDRGEALGDDGAATRRRRARDDPHAAERRLERSALDDRGTQRGRPRARAELARRRAAPSSRRRSSQGPSRSSPRARGSRRSRAPRPCARESGRGSRAGTAARPVISTPVRASSSAGSNSAAHGSRPWRSCASARPATSPGTATDDGPTWNTCVEASPKSITPRPSAPAAVRGRRRSSRAVSARRPASRRSRKPATSGARQRPLGDERGERGGDDRVDGVAAVGKRPRAGLGGVAVSCCNGSTHGEERRGSCPPGARAGLTGEMFGICVDLRRSRSRMRLSRRGFPVPPRAQCPRGTPARGVRRRADLPQAAARTCRERACGYDAENTWRKRHWAMAGISLAVLAALCVSPSLLGDRV